MGRRHFSTAIAVSAFLGLFPLAAATRADPPDDGRAECTKDLMFVFDASGSMGTTDLSLIEPHIMRVKRALRRVLPEIPASRRMGLIIYGEGAYNQCDSIVLKVRPQTNAAALIMAEVDKVQPAGRTPLTESVREAAEVLDYRHVASVVVLLTDGEETCGGKPCEMAEALKADATDLTIHVIGYRHAQASGLGATFGARCLADETGGLYLPVETEDQLADALRRTLTCPLTTDRRDGPPSLTTAAMQSRAP